MTGLTGLTGFIGTEVTEMHIAKSPQPGTANLFSTGQIARCEHLRIYPLLNRPAGAGRFDAGVNALDPGSGAGVTLRVNWVRLGLVFWFVVDLVYSLVHIIKGVSVISSSSKMGLFGKKSFRGKAPFSFFQNVGM
ncbi:MAG: hypothetical protein ACYSOO_06195 [Planctomycetota bacterium]